MKEHKGQYYKARYPSGSGELAETADTITEMKRIINDANDRSEKAGYRKTSWLIVLVSWSSKYSDDGAFLSSKKEENAVMYYPARVDCGEEV